MRIGHGFDVHPFELSKPLMLGGVLIPHTHGMEGHSDGDVVLHALCDALLGAASAGDIGEYFPSSDPSYRNISSRILLKEVYHLVQKLQLLISHVDITIIAQVPMLGPYKKEMGQVIAHDLELPIHAVNVKATTTDGLGFTGRCEGIAATAVVLLKEKNNNEDFAK